ncbi:unnamed protein product [marine sediment metagenome]|uniref:Uncharacterized protein n=1 Tax=marine sediment metagenome TaxID=412755 RepID=X1RIC6_9ZZZZ
MAEEKLTDYQADILEVIVNNSVETISYHKPQIQLGSVVENKSKDETAEALRSLENKFGVLALDPKLKFGPFNKCGYRVINLDQAKKLYDSYVREREE